MSTIPGSTKLSGPKEYSIHVHLSRKHENSTNKFYALATRTLLPHSKTYIHMPGDREVGTNT